MDAQAARSGRIGVAGRRGFDPARRVVGRKRHMLTDTDTDTDVRLLLAIVSPANLHDSHGGVALLEALQQPWPFFKVCFADQAYAGKRAGSPTQIKVEIVSTPEGQKGFAVQSRLSVVERTFGWISRCRKLDRDHEATHSAATALFVFTAVMVLVRQIAQQS